MNNQIIVSNHGEPFGKIKKLFVQAKSEIVIFSPYITVSTLKELEIPINRKVTIITSLKVKDILFGASDLNLYPYAKSRSITVFINNSIHLKVYLSDWESYIFGSSNLTKRGLSIAQGHNYELNSFVEKINMDTSIYFRKIVTESYLMTQDIYNVVSEALKKQPKLEEIDEVEIQKLRNDKTYLVSSLPMTKSIRRLYELVQNRFDTNDVEERNCAIHDYILFKIEDNASFEEFKHHLTLHFFDNGLIKELLEFIDSAERYFGEVKEWLQNHCHDVPVPSRRELTGNIQVLYEWIVELSEGAYKVDRPKHSERISRVKS